MLFHTYNELRRGSGNFPADSEIESRLQIYTSHMNNLLLAFEILRTLEKYIHENFNKKLFFVYEKKKIANFANKAPAQLSNCQPHSKKSI